MCDAFLIPLLFAVDPTDELDDYSVIAGGLEHWLTKDYQLRVEELTRLTDMVNQLAATLNRECVVIPHVQYEVNGMLNHLDRLYPDGVWKTLPENLSSEVRSGGN